MFNVVGHDAAIEAFRGALSAQRLHHAWLMTGPPQIGKTTLSLYFARLLLKATDPGSAAAKRIEAGTHGDLLIIAPGNGGTKSAQSQSIVVGDVRPIQQLLHHTPAEGGWRVVVVKGGDHLNSFAANAILKLLEEPPEKTIFFIIADNPAAVIPTIRSRCRQLMLHPLQDADMRVFLRDRAIRDEPSLTDLLMRAQGRPGFALAALGDHDKDIIDLAENLMAGNASPLTPTQAERVGRAERGFLTFCDLLQEHVRQTALKHGRSGACREASHAAELYQSLTSLRHQTESSNLDKTQAVLQAADIVSKL